MSARAVTLLLCLLVAGCSTPAPAKKPDADKPTEQPAAPQSPYANPSWDQPPP